MSSTRWNEEARSSAAKSFTGDDACTFFTVDRNFIIISYYLKTGVTKNHRYSGFYVILYLIGTATSVI